MVRTPERERFLSEIKMDDPARRRDAQILGLEAFSDHIEPRSSDASTLLRSRIENLRFTEAEIDTRTFISNIFISAGLSHLLSDGDFEGLDTMIAIQYKANELVTQILQPPEGIDQETWEKAIQTFFSRHKPSTPRYLKEIVSEVGSHDWITDKAFIRVAIGKTLFKSFLNGEDPLPIFYGITTTIIEGAKKIIENDVGETRIIFSDRIGKEIQVKPMTQPGALSEDRQTKIEACERALEFLANHPGCCTPALITDLKKQLQAATRYGDNPRVLARNGYHQAHFAFPRDATLPIEVYSFIRAKYPKHSRDSIWTLEIAMIVSIEKLFDALNPKDGTDGIDNLVEKIVHALEVIKTLGCVPNVEIHGINLEPLDDLLTSVAREIFQDQTNFQPRTEIHVDETLVAYHFIRRAFQAIGEPDGDIFDKPTRDRILKKIMEELDTREQDGQVNLNKRLIPHFFARADELLIKPAESAQATATKTRPCRKTRRKT